MFLTPERLPRLLRETPGQRTDPAIYYLLTPFFTGYWAFLRPKDKGVEISDVLLIWEDVCFLIEAKTRESAGKASTKWIRAKIEDGFRQLNERAEMLQSGKLRKLTNKWRGDYEFEREKINHYYGVLVLQHFSDAYDPREIALDSFKASKIPVQVFSFADFAELFRFINTPIDFLVYYELRSVYGRKHYLNVHEEFDIYKSIILQWTKLVTENSISSQSRDEILEEERFLLSYTKAILSTKNAQERDYMTVAWGLLIDLAIASLCKEAPMDETGKRSSSDEHSYLMESVEFMAELSRRRRCAYGELWYSSALRSHESNEIEYVHGLSPSRNRSYVFIASQLASAELISAFVRAYAEEIMDEYNTTSCILYCATTERILRTVDYIRELVVGRHDTSELEETDMLDTQSAFVTR